MIKTITLATLAEATPSEVFNFVAHHLLTQFRSAMEESNCRYKYNGLACAAGCLVSDEEYDPDMEGIPWDSLVARNRVPVAKGDLILALQRVHDRFEPEDWPDELRLVALSRSLRIEPEVQALIDLRSTK